MLSFGKLPKVNGSKKKLWCFLQKEVKSMSDQSKFQLQTKFLNSDVKTIEF